MRRKFQWRRNWLLAALLVMVPALLTIPATNANADPANVYMRDCVGDTGATPSNPPCWNWWSSPDIAVCATPAWCASDVPVVPGNTYFVVVTLNNPGDQVTGQLSLFSTVSSGASTWPGSWALISSAGSTVPTGIASRQLIFGWTTPKSVPPGQHFCLAAVWTSPTDSLTSYPDMASFVVNNRNVAQHNVVMASLSINQPVMVLFNLRDGLPTPDRAGLTFVPSGQLPFIGPGRLVIDLGQTLASRWIAAGAQGSGIRQVGPTQVQIVDPNEARINGLTLNPGDDFGLSLNFTAGSAAQGNQYTAELEQTDSQGRTDGGVEYHIAVK